MRLDVPRSIERIVVLHPDGPMTIHKARKKRKGSKSLKPMAKLARVGAKALAVHANTLLDAHSKSENKKRDGGLKDAMKNSAKAQRRSAKVWRKAYR